MPARQPSNRYRISLPRYHGPDVYDTAGLYDGQMMRDGEDDADFAHAC